MHRIWLVALGGALGSVARYVLSGFVHRYAPASFPFGTFTVNVAGCLAFGFVAGITLDRPSVGSSARTFLLIGLLGGFTTFSTFSFETIELLRDAQFVRASVNVLGQVLLGLAALWAGSAVSRGL